MDALSAPFGAEALQENAGGLPCRAIRLIPEPQGVDGLVDRFAAEGAARQAGNIRVGPAKRHDPAHGAHGAGEGERRGERAPIKKLLLARPDLVLGKAEVERHPLQGGGERHAGETMRIHQELRGRALAGAGKAGEADDHFAHATCSAGKLTQPPAPFSGGSSRRMVE